MRKKLIGIGVIALVLALLLTLAPACGNGEEEPAPGVTPTPKPGVTPTPGVTPPPSGEVKTLKIGFMAPLSGSAAGWGVDAERGTKWAADRVNAAGGIKVGDDRYMIEVVSCDTKATGNVAAECASELVYDEGIHYVVGPVVTKDAVDPILTQGKTFYAAISGNAWLSPDMPYRLNLVGTFDQWIFTWYDQAVPRHPEVKNVAILHRLDPGGEYGMEQSKIAAAAHGLTVVAAEFVPSFSPDFYPILTKILPENPDVIESCSLMPGDAALIVKQARELGYQGQFWFGNGTPTATFLDIAGETHSWGISTNIPDYSADIYSGKTRDLYADWMENYARPGETEVLLVTTTGFNAVLFYAQVIEEAGSIDPDDAMQVIDDPNFTFDTFSDNGLHLGGCERFGNCGIIAHPLAYGEIIDADNMQLSMGEELIWTP